ncbi:RNA polymerase II transcription factor B subunit 1 [Elasticomyces elasticus]|nr:RNA polymerase II transcription factor B subunit 1 [Elasticomyces elasticus]KAK4978101.1 RNA polymerase II transcription factor B subunit 1 [Elasticomyces elasticus]
MPPAKTSVVYKKKDGSLTVGDDTKYLFWTPSAPPGASPAVTIPVADITNLQQTGEASAKVALKVFVKEESYVFNFTSKDAARKEQVAVTDTLRDAIAALKAGTSLPSAPRAAQNNGEGAANQSGALTMAKAVSAKPQDEGWYDDSRLKSDFKLQRSLLVSNGVLNDRFTRALSDKPDSVTVPQFTAQFWSTRLHLLRAHAMETAQNVSEYNVLPEIKYTTTIVNDEPIKTLNMTKEQIALIFKQYPVVAVAFNELLPKPFPDPPTFWSRFFASRLLKKLKGMEIEPEKDPADPVLDKYLDYQQAMGPASLAFIPRTIDLEGNEQNTKFRLEGEFTMKAGRHDKPILHLLNQMSEKLLSHVAPEDGEAHAPIGMDEETFDQLQLRDLAMQDSDNRVVLNVREQQRYTHAQDDDDLSADARLYAKQDPSAVITSLRDDVQPVNFGSDEQGTLKLDRVIGVDEDEDEDEDMDDGSNGHTNGAKTKKVRIGSQASLADASTSIISSISQRRRNASSDAHSLNGLSQTVFDTLTMTHNTTTEFLHYFWTLFLSGDSSRVNELTGLVATLDRSLDRINAVGAQAEKEREERLEKMRLQVKEYFQRTGKKRRIDDSAVGGGKKVVDQMVRPTVEAIKVASQAYRRALEAQMKEAKRVEVGSSSRQLDMQGSSCAVIEQPADTERFATLIQVA